MILFEDEMTYNPNSNFIEDDPDFYKRTSMFEEDCEDFDEEEEEFTPVFIVSPQDEEEEERIAAYEAHRKKSEQEDEEYRQYCEEMNRYEAVFYGEEDYM